MPSRCFSLKKEAPKDLIISWTGPYKNFIVLYKDKEIAKFDNKESLQKWWIFIVEWKKLEIKLNKIFRLFFELDIIYNWSFVKKSPGDPYMQINHIFWLIVVLGWLNILLWILSWGLHIEAMMDMWFGVVTLLYWLVFLVLWFGVRKKSAIILGAVVVLYLVDLLLTAYFIIWAWASVSGLFVKIIVMLFLMRWFSSIKKIKEHKKIHLL